MKWQGMRDVVKSRLYACNAMQHRHSALLRRQSARANGPISQDSSNALESSQRKRERRIICPNVRNGKGATSV